MYKKKQNKKQRNTQKSNNLIEVSHEDNYWNRVVCQPELKDVFLNPLTAYIYFKVWQILIYEEINVFTVVNSNSFAYKLSCWYFLTLVYEQ